MSRYYGRLRGNRGVVTRCGTKSSGIIAELLSKSTAYYFTLQPYDENTDMIEIEVRDIKTRKILHRTPMYFEVPHE